MGHGPMPNGIQVHLGDTEAPDPILDLVALYVKNLAVPVIEMWMHQALAGKQLFHETLRCMPQTQLCHKSES